MLRRGISPWSIRVIALCLLQTIIANAQNLYTAFGPVSGLPAGSNSEEMFLGDLNGDKETDFGVYGPNHISLLYSSRRETAPSRVVRYTDRRIEKVVSEDCNRDGRSDIVVLTAEPHAIHVYLSGRDTVQLKWSEDLPFAVDDLAVGDINNDRKMDIVLFGKKILGVYVFLGRGNGTFRYQQFILDEFSFSRLMMRDLNGDTMMDLLAYDWVKNELLLFSGITQFKFSAPVSVPLSSELHDVRYANINGDGNPDLLVTYKEQQDAVVYLGDGFGNFRESSRMTLPFVPTVTLVEDINDDGLDDMIVFSEAEKMFSTYISDGDVFSPHGVSYAAGAQPVRILAFHSGKEPALNLAILDASDKQLVLYHNFLYPSSSDEEQRYSLGLQPQSLYIFDANNNGLPDILVTNTRSEHLSLFVNRGNGTFYGQIPIFTEQGAESIHALWKDPSTFVCFTAHPSTDKFVLTEVTFPNFESRFTSSPAPSQAEILSVSYDSISGTFTLLAAGRDVSSIFVSEFVWDAQRPEMAERPLLQLPATSPVSAIDLCDVNNDAVRDLALLSLDEATRSAHVSISLGNNGGGFSPPRMVFTLPDTGIDQANLWCGDINGDQSADIIVQYHSDNYYLAFAYGEQKGESFRKLQEGFPQVMVRRRGDIAFIDVDGDTRNDLIVANALTRMIQVFPAREGGGFSKPKRLLSFPSDGAFAVVDLNRDQIPDYALVYRELGMLKILLGKK